MAGNTFGKIFTVTTFGESHGKGIGVVIDGCPPALVIDNHFIQQQLNRRKPGQSRITTSRNEDDEFEILSGIFDGKTTGAPLTFFIRNNDAKPSDYDALKDVYRPGHADLTYDLKYGIRDHRGGGRSSARETAARVIAGAVAALVLNKNNIKVDAYVSRIGPVEMNEKNSANFTDPESNLVRCPDPEAAEKMIAYIDQLKSAGDTTGGIITCRVKNYPSGAGEPVFDKLQADLAKAMLSINAVKGFDYGHGFDDVNLKGSELNDEFRKDEEGNIISRNNFSGGILGGISTGEEIYFRTVFKPVSTLQMKREAITQSGDPLTLEPGGRHDPCVLPRAVPIVEAMTRIVLLDHLLRQRATGI